jgi:hypothetical protein
VGDWLGFGKRNVCEILGSLSIGVEGASFVGCETVSLSE